MLVCIYLCVEAQTVFCWHLLTQKWCHRRSICSNAIGGDNIGSRRKPLVLKRYGFAFMRVTHLCKRIVERTILFSTVRYVQPHVRVMPLQMYRCHFTPGDVFHGGDVDLFEVDTSTTFWRARLMQRILIDLTDLSISSFYSFCPALAVISNVLNLSPNVAVSFTLVRR